VIRTAIDSPIGEATPTIYRGLGMLDKSRSTCGFLAEARTHQHSLQWEIELRSIERKIMTSQLELLIQQATQLDRDKRIELITHLANSLHSSNDSTSEPVLTEIQQSQLVGAACLQDNRLRSEIEIGLEQVRSGNTVDGETVFANLRARVDGYRDLEAIFRSK
jgi:hypothetical protein